MTVFLTSFDPVRISAKSAVTLGKFDGFHRGHQKLICEIIENKERLSTVVCAFDMGEERRLMTEDEKRSLLNGRVDVLVQSPLTQQIRQMPPEKFVQSILAEKLRAGFICVGEDFHFGYGARGDVRLLQSLSHVYDYRVGVMEKEKKDGEVISSTRIKAAMKTGNVETANRLLGYTYSVDGVVREGRQIGRTIGFPTMNVSVDPRKLLPAHGVYICVIEIDGKRYRGIANIGTNPTVTDEDRVSLEAYAFDFSADVYGEHVRVYLLHYIRPEKKMTSIEMLRTVIASDQSYALHWFSICEDHDVARLEDALVCR